MEKTLAFILVTLLYTCGFSQETFFTSGQGQGQWNDPHSWMLGENGPISSRVPHPEADIVIRHSLTHTVDRAYTHHGTIQVQKGNSYELMGSGSFTYAGKLFELRGTLIAATDVYHKSHDASPSNFVVRNTGLMYALRDFHTDFGSEILIEQPVCGAMYIYGSFQVHGDDSRVVGAAKIIASDVKAWRMNGEEVQGDADVNSHISSLFGNNIEIFSSEDACELGTTVLKGAGGHTPGIELTDFEATISESVIEVLMETQSLATLPRFSLERAWENQDFTEFEEISSEVINETQGAFKIHDQEDPNKQRSYRLSYVNELGEKVILGLIKVGAGPQMAAYPNPYNHQEVLSIQMQGFKGSEQLNINIMDLQGKSIWKDQVQSNAIGNIKYQLQPDLLPGTYMVWVASADAVKTQRLVVF